MRGELLESEASDPLQDILDAMTSLGFDNYVESLKPYLAKYRMVSPPS